MAGPKDRSFAQILTETAIVRDTTDTAVVYDLVVRYDPERFRDPRVGVYPLGFEDQFIHWGKRVALFTRSTAWKSGRFYLHDLSSGRQAWAYTEDARQLYPRSKDVAFPAVANPGELAQLQRWLKLIHATEHPTDQRTMSTWFRLMMLESRDQVVERVLAERAAEDTSAAP